MFQHIQGDPLLNDALLTGPNHGQCIFDIIIGFWLYKVALARDIKKAFLMVGVAG